MGRDRRFREFPDLLRSDDLLVVNNTRVFPARLYGHRSGQRAQPLSPHNPAARDFLRGRVEVLLTRQVADDPNEWECLVRPGRKIGVGEKLYFGDSPVAPYEEGPHNSKPRSSNAAGFGERRIQFAQCPIFFADRAHWTRAASALYRSRRRRCGPRALPDCVRPGPGVGGGAYRRFTLYARDPGADSSTRR